MFSPRTYCETQSGEDKLLILRATHSGLDTHSRTNLQTHHEDGARWRGFLPAQQRHSALVWCGLWTHRGMTNSTDQSRWCFREVAGAGGRLWQHRLGRKCSRSSLSVGSAATKVPTNRKHRTHGDGEWTVMMNNTVTMDTGRQIPKTARG